ncbi:MAG: YitT family protein, partial [Aristaeellaceae bacterium]
MTHSRRHLIFTLTLTALGNICLALSAQLFLLPSGLPTGGTTGIALVVQAFTGIPVSAFVLVFNVAMLLLGLAVMGKQFAATTVLSSFLYPAALEVFG